MDTNIHSYTCNGREMDIYINVNIDTNVSLCRHLVKIEKLNPPPLQSSISMKYHKDKGKLGKENQWFLQGQIDAYSSMQEWGTIPL